MVSPRPSLFSSTPQTSHRSADEVREDLHLTQLALPDPFMTGRAGRTPERTAPARQEDVIDLTDSPPPATRQIPEREIIDLDSLPDVNPRLRVPQSRATSAERERQRLRREAMRASTTHTDTNELHVDEIMLPMSVPEMLQRRLLGWTSETEQRRARQRQERTQQGRERRGQRRAPMALPSMVPATNLMDQRNLMNQNYAQLGAQYRAYVHGPNGGGPVGGSTVPQHFLAGGGLTLVPQLAHFQAPDLDYALFNQAFPPYGDVEPPTFATTTKYDPPDPCKEPFTRTFTEGDVLVCPACKYELGGVGDETRRRIFVSKCSHVYCGSCGNGIHSAAKKQGIICKAPLCGKKITKTRIFEAYV